jgi:hypothetical protein
MLKAKNFYFSLIFGLTLSALVGCGGVKAPATPAVSRDELVNNFVILDEKGEAKAPREPVTGLSPFGVFLKAPHFGIRADCSATHVSRGVIVTNAHCVADYRFLKPSDFFLFFYSNKTGLLTHSPISRLLYVGNPDSDDVAFIEIPSEAAAEWDIASSQFAKSVRRYRPDEFENASAPEKESPVVESVALWGFDPLSSTRFEARYPDRQGMVFSPKHCKASRTIPWIATQAEDGSRSLIRKYQPRNKNLDPRLHIMVDECDKSTLYGNSGSLISSENFDRFLGVFHWNLPKEKFLAHEAYYGNRQTWLRVWAGDMKGDPNLSVLNIGTAFESIRTELWSLLPLELRS